MLALFAACLGILTPPGPKAEVYQRDVEFLTTEIGRDAAALIELKRIDWDAVSREFVNLAPASTSDSEHQLLCQRMLSRLQDGHAAIVDAQAPWPDEGGGRRFTGPRVLLVRIGDELFVRQSFKSALEAGITPGMKVLRIDGTSADEWFGATVARMQSRFGYSTLHAAQYDALHRGLADWEGTSILFELAPCEEPDAQSRSITITRSGGPNFVPVGPVFPPEGCMALGRQTYGHTPSGIAYIHLRDVPGDLPEQLDTMLAALTDVPGAIPSKLIIDMRANGGGGCDHAAVAARFKRGQNVVVIIDSWVRSAGETIAGTFKEDLGFTLIGDGPTAGMSSKKKRIKAPSGIFAVSFSVRSNKQRFNGGRGIEGLGITPDRLTPYVASDLRAGVDTQIREAEQLLTERQ
jgi:hypothetical protein